VNGDHKANVGDLVRIASVDHWLQTVDPAGSIPEDVNADGTVNVGDLVAVAGQWLATW
jgi:hypothetical protein